MVRHWKNWIIHHTTKSEGSQRLDEYFRGFSGHLPDFNQEKKVFQLNQEYTNYNKNNDTHYDGQEHADEPISEDHTRLHKAATIETALIVVNSHHAMIFLVLVTGFFPMLTLFKANAGVDTSSNLMA